MLTFSISFFYAQRVTLSLKVTLILSAFRFPLIKVPVTKKIGNYFLKDIIFFIQGIYTLVSRYFMGGRMDGYGIDKGKYRVRTASRRTDS